jgi:hypothetical protein
VLLAALVAFGELGLRLAALARPRLTIDVGPATGPYLSGFSPSVEFPPITARWLLGQGRIELPLDVEPGEGRLWMHVALRTVVPQPLELRLDGQVLGQITLSPTTAPRTWPLPGRAPNDPFADTRLVSLPLATHGGALRLDFNCRTGDTPALAVDWVRLEGLRYRVPGRAFAPRLLGVGFALLGFLYTGSLGRSTLLGCAGALLTSVVAALDPLLLTHVAAKVALPGLLLSLAVAPWLRQRAHGGGLAALLLAGYLLKGAGVFHPGLHAPDVLTHNRYVAAFRASSGSLTERGIAAQRIAGVAYLRFVAGEHYAFPYSPLYYLPFTLLPEDRVVGAMKHVALFAAVAETALVYLLASALLDARLGLWAATLATFLPPLFARLVWAMWPSIVGHVADVLALIALYAWLRHPDSRARRAVLAAATLLAFSAYVSGFVMVGALLLAAALLERRHSGLLLLLLAGAGALAVTVVYAAHVRPLVATLLPALVQPGTATPAEPAVDFATALSRIPLFYGWAYPLLAAAGLWLSTRLVGRPALRFLRIYALAAVLLVLARATTGGLLKGLKEMMFVGPLVVLLTALALRALAARGPWARRTAVAIAVGLVLHGLFLYWGYLIPGLALVAPS